MTSELRISTAAALFLALTALGCSGKSETPQPATSASAPAAPASGGGVAVSGKLAPSVAEPAALVVLEPSSPVQVPIKAEPAIMDQAGTEFIPAFLLAQAGQTVEFRNSEDVLHNIRVTEVSEQKPIFNVATPPFGKYEYKFERTGVYNVGCDIHSTMRADILVTGTPYTATTGPDGAFTIGNVTPGAYTLTVYSGAVPFARTIDVKSPHTDLGTIQ
jgi:plastocyanin